MILNYTSGMLHAETLQADAETIYDLAGQLRVDIAQNSPETVPLLRTIHEFKPSENTIREIKENIVASNTSTIIIAAGMGNRMGVLTDDK